MAKKIKALTPLQKANEKIEKLKKEIEVWKKDTKILVDDRNEMMDDKNKIAKKLKEKEDIIRDLELRLGRANSENRDFIARVAFLEGQVSVYENLNETDEEDSWFPEKTENVGRKTYMESHTM